MSNHRNHTLILLLAILAAVGVSCSEIEELPDFSTIAPLDTYIISGPEGGSVVTEPAVTFQFGGSNSFVSEFSYRCAPKQENWSEWSPDTSIKLEYLDQGDYVFEVKGRYDAENEDDTPAQRTFTVNIPGPGMLLKPFKQNVLLGQEFEMDVLADEVEDVAFIHLILKFEPSKLQIVDARPGEIFHQGKSPAFFKSIDNSQGIADINIGTFAATPSRIDGTGAVATIRFKSVSAGEGSVDFDAKSEFRDSANKPIGIATRIGGVIEITEESKTE